MPRVVVDARSVSASKSGIGNYVEALLRHMIPLAPELSWLLLRHPSAEEPWSSDRAVRELRLPGATKSVATVTQVGRALRDVRFDLYHAPAELVPLGLGRPFVSTIHDLMWLEAPRLGSAFVPVRWANGLWYRANLRRAVHGSRVLIAVSAATRAALGRHFPDAVERTVVVHHGIEHERYTCPTLPAYPEHLVPRGVDYALVVGQGSPYKNHDGMVRAYVEAMAGRVDHRLVLVRRFTRVDPAMGRLLRRPEVRQRVLTLPFVTDAELRALYAHAQMVLAVSHYEGFGLPALEAFAMGKPVLASTADAVVEVTGRAALQVPSTDHAAIVNAIRRLAHDAALREHLARAGRERAREFSWLATARATLDVYRRALNAPRAQR